MEHSDAMNSLPRRIMEYAEATRALSRVVRSDRLLRICRGVYMSPIQTKFGLRAPRLEKRLAFLSALWGEVIVPNGGGAANWLGLTTQNTVRSVYLTSGPDRLPHFGAHAAELRHAPAWQLTAPHRTAAVVIRALAWLGPNEVEKALDVVIPPGHRGGLERPRRRRAVMPAWMAEPLGRRLAHG